MRGIVPLSQMRMPLPASALTLSLVVAFPCFKLHAAADANWATYLGDKAASHYSTLTEITPENVGRLEVAWTWNGPDARPTSQIQCNPLIIDGVMYATTAGLKVLALDAQSGTVKWEFTPPDAGGVNRGLAYWTDGTDRRILLGSGQWLHAIDARTGQAIESFGQHGRVDLSLGLDRDVTGLSIQANTPGVIFRDLIIMGMRVGEGPALAAPGHIRAFNVRTGQFVWRFHTIPHPGEPGYETWPEDAWKRIGGVNVWTGMTVDEERGLVFCPVGSAAFDFWGGDRLGDNLYANCLLVLDAATGRHVWHYQFVHHDLWDRDPPSPPVLLTVRHGGREIAAVAQTTKSGHVFVFDRTTGEPLFPIENVAIPSSDLVGEVAAKFQPLPTKPAPFARQLFTADEITDRTPEAHRAVLEQFTRLRPHTRFGPPSREGTIIFPGFDGGAEWGGAAADPGGVLYVNSNEMPWILTMIDATRSSTPGEQIFLQNCAACHGPDRRGNSTHTIPSLVDLAQRLTNEQAMDVVTHGRAVMPSFAFLQEKQRRAVVAYLRGEPEGPAGEQAPSAAGAPPYTTTGYNRWFDPEGYPAVKPPWGTLNAIDLNTGDYLWRVPLGELPELTARGIPPTGTENYGGPLVTAGGVIFIGASKDEYFRAFDRHSGKELWRMKLPAGGYATPATYEAGGRQYVVIACGGGKMGTKSGDTYMAFALPASK